MNNEFGIWTLWPHILSWVICIFDITRTNLSLLSHVWSSGSDQALSFPGRLCAYTLYCLLDLCFTINYTVMKLPKFSPTPWWKKKSYSSHQVNQTFVFGFQFYGSTIIPSFMLKLLTVVPQWSHKARSKQHSTFRRQWFVLMKMVTNAIRYYYRDASVHTTLGKFREMFPKCICLRFNLAT